MIYVDDLAQEIRRVDGSNSLGAGALAEALMPFLASRLTRQDDEIRKAALEEAANDLSRFADIETERAEGKREGSHARFAALWASIRLRLAASHVRALSQKGDEADG